MAQLLVRNLDSQTVANLKNRAKKHHRSLQGEIKFILEEAANTPIQTHLSSWPPQFLEQIVGGWQGEILTRSPQGDYEQRDDLQ